MKVAIRLLQRFLYTVVLLWVAFMTVALFVNRNSTDMTIRQKILNTVYPLIMWAQKKTATKLSSSVTATPVSFYTLTAESNDGVMLNFSDFKGKKVLLVNTASDCGYTAQYAELQQLQEQFPDNLVVLGFPANDFKEQEKGSDADIAVFCKRNFGVTFPLAKKSVVVKGSLQHPVYRWLTDKAQNGWNSKAPSWNFSKYLVDESGRLVHYFDPGVSPLSKDVTDAVRQ